MPRSVPITLIVLALAACNTAPPPIVILNQTDVNLPSSSGEFIDVLMVGDTDDHFTPPAKKPITSGVVSNLSNIERFFRFAASYTGMGLHIKKIAADSFTCQNLYVGVHQLALAPGRVHIFYYAGHGVRLPESRFGAVNLPGTLTAAESAATFDMPWLACGTPDPKFPFPRLVDIAGELSRSDGKLAIAISDSCNKFDGYDKELPGQGGSSSAAVLIANDRRYVGLFTKDVGIKMMAGTQPNNYSFYPDDGGYFTTRLLTIVSQMPNTNNLTWKQVGAALGSIATHNPDQPYQTPIFREADGLTLSGL